ncbi:MAG TPA: ThuA domain-containing protein [Chloroflexota bacterium]|nr:ThuA domain-containing protein [Chloroflexota bacterium]
MRGDTREALIVWGGWEVHQPEQVAAIFAERLRGHGFAVTVADTLDALCDEERLRAYALIVPIWTMGEIRTDQLRPLLAAVEGGVGIGGCHGGMCDAFRNAPDFQFMTGGQWVAHPGNDGVRYRVEIRDRDHFITQGVEDFTISTEQYYLHTDPANRVLATTRFPVADGPHAANGPVDMPVVWTKYHGKGRVFYCSLGHQANIVRLPDVERLCLRGLLWAAHAETVAGESE